MLKGLRTLKVNFLFKVFVFFFFLFVFLNIAGSKNFVYAAGCKSAGTVCTTTPECCVPLVCTFGGIFKQCLTAPIPPPLPPPAIVPIIEIVPLFGALASILIPGGIALALIRIAWSGYEFMISEGNPQKVAEAREDFIASVTGALFILLSVVTFSVILKSFLGDPRF